MDQHVGVEKQQRETAHTRKLEHELQQQQIITEISLSAIQMTDLQQLMDESLSLICTSLEIPFGMVLEAQPEDDVLTCISGYGRMFETQEPVFIGAGRDTQPGYTFQTGKSIILEDVRADSRFRGIPFITQFGIISGITVQIPGRVKPFGVLALYSNQQHSFTSDIVHILMAAANILASAIERRRVEDEIRFSHDQLSVILKSAADGITVQDERGRLVYANDAAAHAIGYESEASLLSAAPEEILQRFELFSENGSPFHPDQLPGRLVQKGLPEAQAVVGFKMVGTGQIRWSIIKSRPVLSPDGKHTLSVNIFQDITELKHNQETQRFIAEAGKIFSSSLDYQTTLQNVAELAVRGFADWCTVSLVEDNILHNVAVAHINPEKVLLVRSLEQRYPPDINDSRSAVVQVLKSGKPVFMPEITTEMIQNSPRDEEYKRQAISLGLHAAVVLPLIVHGRTIGALTLIWAETNRRYTDKDVELAEELSRRAAIAIDNARLYSEVQQVNQMLEQRVQQRTDQLQSLIAKLRSEISERKRAQDKLVQNEAMLEGLFEAAPDATLLVDRDGIVLRVNAQTEMMFGYRRDDILGKPVDNLFPPRFRYVHKNYRHKLLAEPAYRQEAGGVELYGRRSDGSEFPVEIVQSPLQTKDGMRTISAIRDVTRRKQMEAELAEVQRRLIDSLESERLLLAQEIHDGAIQDLYGITFALKGLEDLLIENPLDSTSAEDYLKSSKENLQLAIDELRGICGELRPPTLAPFGLEKAIMAHIDQVRDSHPEISIHLDLTPDNQLLPEHMRLAMYRVYQHAVSNVVRHAAAKNLWVTFTINSDHILLEIKDDGVGFNLPSRWVELAREGHLGLIGTAERAEAIGAQLNITSAPGHGTDIQVIIPQGKPLEPEMRAANWLLHRK